MTITVYTFCWNGMVLLPHFFEHYKWANKIIVYDNGSDDGSQEFVKSQRNGELRFYDTNNKYDELSLLNLKNNCWKNDTSDWVIVCDTDEFLMEYEKLENYIGEVCIFNCKCWEMVSEIIPSDFKTISLKYHHPWWSSKCLCFNPRIKEINYRPGAHSCKPEPNNKLLGIFDYYHYNTLSEDYLVKNRQAIASRMSDNNFTIPGLVKNYLVTEDEIRKEFKKRLLLALQGRDDKWKT